MHDYFRHYLHSAVNQVGEGDRYLDLLGEWDKMLARGLTTWAEKPEPTRSDCHAVEREPELRGFPHGPRHRFRRRRVQARGDSSVPRQTDSRLRFNPAPGGRARSVTLQTRR